MRLSIFTTVTRPTMRGDLFNEAFNCYEELADEVVVIDGDEIGYEVDRETIRGKHKKIRWIEKADYRWPDEFRWDLIGRQFQRGFEACTGDWVIHADLDFIWHENDFEAIRQACYDNRNKPAFAMLKRQFVLPDRFNVKSRLVTAVNKARYGDYIKFNSGGDLCQPSLDGKYLAPKDVSQTSIPIWNYDKILKTKEQITNDVGRMARAWERYFGEAKLGYTDEEAYNEWYKMMKGRYSKPHEFVPLKDHPKFMQNTIRNLTEDQFGYSGFGIGKVEYV